MMINKIFVAITLVTLACMSLHSEERDKHYDVSASVDKSTLDSQSPERYCHCGRDPQSPLVYIGEKANIYDKDFQLTKQTYTLNNHKKTIAVKKKTTVQFENEIIEQKTVSVILFAIPFSTSSSAFMPSGGDSAAITPQQRHSGQTLVAKIQQNNVKQYLTNPKLSLYTLEQRQKLSAAATQCGMLSSFGSNFPPSFA